MLAIFSYLIIDYGYLGYRYIVLSQITKSVANNIASEVNIDQSPYIDYSRKEAAKRQLESNMLLNNIDTSSLDNSTAPGCEYTNDSCIVIFNTPQGCNVTNPLDNKTYCTPFISIRVKVFQKTIITQKTIPISVVFTTEAIREPTTNNPPTLPPTPTPLPKIKISK